MNTTSRIFDLSIICRICLLLLFSSGLYAGLIDTEVGQTESGFSVHSTDQAQTRLGHVMLSVVSGNDLSVTYTPKHQPGNVKTGTITSAQMLNIVSNLGSHEMPEGMYMNQVPAAISCLYAWDLAESAIIHPSETLSVVKVSVNQSNDFEMHLTGTKDDSGNPFNAVVTIRPYQCTGCKIWVKLENEKGHSLQYVVNFGNKSRMFSRKVVKACPGYRDTDARTTGFCCWW